MIVLSRQKDIKQEASVGVRRTGGSDDDGFDDINSLVVNTKEDGAIEASRNVGRQDGELLGDG